MDKKAEYRFYDLLSAKLSGDATSADLLQIQQFLQQYPEMHFLYNEVMAPVYFHQEEEGQTSQAYAAHYTKLMLAVPETPIATTETPAHKKRGKRKGLYIKIAVAAAVIAIAFGVANFVTTNNNNFLTLNNGRSIGNHNKNVMVTPKGSKSKLTLPDGTLVLLNADSKISYGEDYNKEVRKVTLTGEAYFDVKQDALRPFVIHTGKADIKVLGTAFNVKNYPGSMFETSLIRGKIEITLNDKTGKKIILNPSQKFVIADTAIAIAYHNINTTVEKAVYTFEIMPITIMDSVVAETSWMSNRLIFTNRPLREIAQDLERSYNIKVTFKTSNALSYRYTGTFENQELDEVMKILKLSKNINYKIKSKELIIE